MLKSLPFFAVPGLLTWAVLPSLNLVTAGSAAAGIIIGNG
jgi:hypothetical protein